MGAYNGPIRITPGYRAEIRQRRADREREALSAAQRYSGLFEKDRRSPPPGPPPRGGRIGVLYG